MQEKTVTVAGKIYRLEEPFFVLATQNPIEQEGTYPLPEAQLDRFLFELLIDYPSLEEERRVVEQHSFAPLEKLRAVMSRAEILGLREAVAQIPAAPNVVDYAVRLVRATRPGSHGQAPDYIKRWIRWGASPRASQYPDSGRARPRGLPGPVQRGLRRRGGHRAAGVAAPADPDIPGRRRRQDDG